MKRRRGSKNSQGSTTAVTVVVIIRACGWRGKERRDEQMSA